MVNKLEAFCGKHNIKPDVTAIVVGILLILFGIIFANWPSTAQAGYSSFRSTPSFSRSYSYSRPSYRATPSVPKVSSPKVTAPKVSSPKPSTTKASSPITKTQPAASVSAPVVSSPSPLWYMVPFMWMGLVDNDGPDAEGDE
ncbi:FtsZ-interacting cell division protein ZipA [Thalassospira sp. MBR-102]